MRSSRPTVALIKYSTDSRWDIWGDRTFENIAVHELGHVLGFEHRTLDNSGKVAQEPTPHYTREEAIRAFDAAGGDGWTGDKVPMEDRASPSHWRDEDRLCGGGDGILDEEIMAPWIYSGAAISRITLEVLAELEYEIDFQKAEDYRVRLPEEGTVADEVGVSVHGDVRPWP